MKYLNSLQSEWIKRKRSSVTWLVLIGSFFVPAMMLVSRFYHHNQSVMENSSDGVWMKLFDQCWQFMSIFLLPMGITLAASLITQIEYRNNTWKQLYTSPQSLSTIFWSKYSIVLITLLQFFIYFTIGIYLCGSLPSLVYPDVPYPSESFPIGDFLVADFKFFVKCLPVLALQYLLSLHLKNFILPIAVGFVLVVSSLFASGWKYIYVIPYTYAPMQYLTNDFTINPNVNIYVWAIGYFILFTAINYILFLLKSQSVISAKFYKLSHKKRVAYVLAPIIVLLCFYVYIANSNKEPEKIGNLSPAEIEKNIQNTGQNLGAFVVSGVNDKDWTIEGRMKYYNVKGLSVAVVHNYKIEWARAYGFADSEEQKPVTVNTLFIPGSLSKSLNALGLLKLAGEKKVDLYKDINTYLASWKFPYDSVSRNKKITILNLLSHSAGLSVHGFKGYSYGETLPSVVQILDGKKPANSDPVRSIFEPGLKVQYSGGGTMISQLILMDVSGEPYDKYMQENILNPVGMNNSFYTQPAPPDKMNLLATGYNTLGKPIKGKQPILAEQAAGGLWTTPTDMCKFIIEIQLSLKGKSNKVLSKEMTELMITPYLDNNAALGVFMEEFRGTEYFSHEAANVGFSGAYYGSVEDGNGLAVFINSENKDIIREIRESVIDVYGWKGFQKKAVKKVVPVAEAILKTYVGNYVFVNDKGNKDTAAISEKDHIYYYKANGTSRKMYFTSETEFFNLEIPTSKKIIKNAQNKVTAIKVKSGHNERQLNKIN